MSPVDLDYEIGQLATITDLSTPLNDVAALGETLSRVSLSPASSALGPVNDAETTEQMTALSHNDRNTSLNEALPSHDVVSQSNAIAALSSTSSALVLLDSAPASDISSNVPARGPFEIQENESDLPGVDAQIGTVFHPFKRLPMECQLLIWKFALPEPAMFCLLSVISYEDLAP